MFLILLLKNRYNEQPGRQKPAFAGNGMKYKELEAEHEKKSIGEKRA